MHNFNIIHPVCTKTQGQFNARSHLIATIRPRFPLHANANIQYFIARSFIVLALTASTVCHYYISRLHSSNMNRDCLVEASYSLNGVVEGCYPA
jgi:hypothetical protein